jgi:quercetin dioxygenase-like cupin family protein
MFGSAKTGAEVTNPQIHQDDYEMCWVLEGKVQICLPNESYVLKGGESVQFDAVLVHTYKVLEDCRLIIVHITKQKRF